MAGNRRRRIEDELADWRASTRREAAAAQGSVEASDAAEESEEHRQEYERLTGEVLDEQRRDEPDRGDPGPV